MGIPRLFTLNMEFIVRVRSDDCKLISSFLPSLQSFLVHFGTNTFALKQEKLLQSNR